MKNNKIKSLKVTKPHIILGVGFLCTCLCLYFFINGLYELNQKIKEKNNEKLQIDNALEIKGQSIYLDGDEVYKFLPVSGGTITINDSLGTRKITVESFMIGDTPVNSRLQEYIVNGIRVDENAAEKYFLFPSSLGTRENWENFIERLNIKTGHKFRLPTNDEWEYAARGGKYSYHYKYAGSNNIETVAIYKENCEGLEYFGLKTKRPNELGLYDMSGGVWELTSTKIEDVFPDVKLYNSLAEANRKTDPKFYNEIKEYQEACISRGGNYDSPANECELNFCSSAYRIKTGARLVMEY